jgi:Zn-dependent protease with chaperone function
MHSDRVYPGRMSDGRTAASQQVQISLTGEGLDIRGGAEPLLWPYASLTSAEPIRANSLDTLLSSDTMPGATLFVEGAEFMGGLRERAPNLSVAALRWSYAKPGLIFTGTVAAIAAAVWLFDLSPARTVAGWMPDAARVRMGQQVIQSMTRNKATCHTEEGRAALDKLAGRLTSVSGAREKFNVVVVDWDLLNAFAAPGSQIVLTRELISDAKSPDEVAGVLAHEMGHGLELHPETALVRAIGISAAIELMTGGGSGGTMANIGGFLAQLNYTRVAEREADAHALRILKASAISPKGLADFFERLSKLEGDQSDTPLPQPKEGGKDESAAKSERYDRYISTGADLLRTHPQSRDRYESIRQQAGYDATPSLSDQEWKDLRSICKNAKKSQKDKSDTSDKK